jgi:hypothetical protein
MNAATFKIKILPRRMAKKGEAANYCGLPVKRFEADFPLAQRAEGAQEEDDCLMSPPLIQRRTRKPSFKKRLAG